MVVDSALVLRAVHEGPMRMEAKGVAMGVQISIAYDLKITQERRAVAPPSLEPAEREPEEAGAPGN